MPEGWEKFKKLCFEAYYSVEYTPADEAAVGVFKFKSSQPLAKYGVYRNVITTEKTEVYECLVPEIISGLENIGDATPSIGIVAPGSYNNKVYVKNIWFE